MRFVRSDDPGLARFQDRINWLNRLMVDCDCNRQTLSAIEAAEVHAANLCGGQDRFAGDTDDVHAQGVEERIVADPVAKLFKARSEQRRERVNALRDAAQSFRPVINRVHAGHDRQQHLRGADVARGFLAADVLLAGLQRESIRGVAMHIF